MNAATEIVARAALDEVTLAARHGRGAGDPAARRTNCSTGPPASIPLR